MQLSENSVTARPPAAFATTPSRELRLVITTGRRRIAPSLAGAAAAHVAFLLLLVSVAWVWPPASQARIPQTDTGRLVWVFEGASGGGPGGGGDRIPEPPRRAPLPSVRPAPPSPVEPPENVSEDPREPLAGAVLSAEPFAAPVALVATSEVASPSRGDGSDMGAGRGTDAGIGTRGRDRLGSGSDEGAGDDEGDGQGLELDSPPRLLFGPTPQYTTAAVLRHVEGDVHLECLALPTGSVGECRVVRSVDRNAYGLDDEAARTARRFRFEPATRNGKPVATLVRIVLTFRIQ